MNTGVVTHDTQKIEVIVARTGSSASRGAWIRWMGR